MHVCLIRLIGVAQCTNTSFLNKWYTVQRKHFLFYAPFNMKHYHPQNYYTFYYFIQLCKHFGISLHKLFWGVCYLWLTKGNIASIYIW